MCAMFLRQPEDHLIYKCQEMLKDEHKLVFELRDHAFIQMILTTIVQLRAQKRNRDAKKTERKTGSANES